MVSAAENKNNATDTENTATTILTGTVADENSGESLVGVEVKIDGVKIKPAGSYIDEDDSLEY